MRPLSAGHHRIRRLRRLSRQRADREKEATFVIEGPTLVAEALNAGCPLIEVFAEPSASPELVARLEATGVDCFALAEGTLARVVDVVTPQPIAATASLRWSGVEAMIDGTGAGLLMILVDVADPGNAGTLVRTAEAVGATGVIAVGMTADLFSPKAVRASAGSILRTAVARADELPLTELAAGGWRTVAATVSGAPTATDLAWPARSALVLGSEAHGLAPNLLARVDKRVTLDVADPVESLNVAVAGSVLAFDWRRAQTQP